MTMDLAALDPANSAAELQRIFQWRRFCQFFLQLRGANDDDRQ